VNMTYEVIFSSDQFLIDGATYPRLPFVMDKGGVPHEALNSYIRHLAIRKKRNIEQTITPNISKIVKYLNYLYDNKPPLEYFQSTERFIQRYVNTIKGVGDGTLNMYYSSIYQFLWFCEKSGFCNGVIGITDVDKGIGKFPVPVDPPKDKNAQYSIPIINSLAIKQRDNIGSQYDWDKAYENSASKETPQGERDHLMIRIIREVSIRSIALRYLLVNAFKEELAEGELATDNKAVKIEVDKFGKGRFAMFNTDLYLAIQDYIKQMRPHLIGKYKSNPYLFPGQNKDQPLAKRTIITILEGYGVKAHDGRAISLTEMFIELIKQGLDKNECLLLVSEQANHSLKYQGSTLEKHYLYAKMIFKGWKLKPTGQLVSEAIKLKKRVANLESLLAEVFESASRGDLEAVNKLRNAHRCDRS